MTVAPRSHNPRFGDRTRDDLTRGPPTNSQCRDPRPDNGAPSDDVRVRPCHEVLAIVPASKLRRQPGHPLWIKRALGDDVALGATVGEHGATDGARNPACS